MDNKKTNLAKLKNEFFNAESKSKTLNSKMDAFFHILVLLTALSFAIEMLIIKAKIEMEITPELVISEKWFVFAKILAVFILSLWFLFFVLLIFTSKTIERNFSKIIEAIEIELAKHKTYHLAGNDWYLVEEDDGKMMLVDTDCMIAGNILETTWSYSKNPTSGQHLLDYTNSLADEYFSAIEYAIIQRDIYCKNEKGEGQGKIKGAYMWPMSKKEFENHQDIGDLICTKVDNDYLVANGISCCISTRTFSKKRENTNCGCELWLVRNGSCNSYRIYNASTACHLFAPAFYLNKAMIDHITEAGEIILKPAPELATCE